MGCVACKGRKVGALDRLSVQIMRAVAAELDLPGVKEIMAAHIHGLTGRVEHPFAGPFAVDDNRLLPGDLDAWVEGRAVDIAVEGPAVRNDVHFLAAGTPVRVSAFDAAQLGAELAHAISVRTQRRGPYAMRGGRLAMRLSPRPRRREWATRSRRLVPPWPAIRSTG